MVSVNHLQSHTHCWVSVWDRALNPFKDQIEGPSFSMTNRMELLVSRFVFCLVSFHKNAQYEKSKFFEKRQLFLWTIHKIQRFFYIISLKKEQTGEEVESSNEGINLPQSIKSSWVTLTLCTELSQLLIRQHCEAHNPNSANISRWPTPSFFAAEPDSTCARGVLKKGMQITNLRICSVVS